MHLFSSQIFLSTVLALFSLSYLVHSYDKNKNVFKGFPQYHHRNDKIDSFFNCKDNWPLPTHKDPEIKLNVSEVIRHFGYPCEEHEVETTDGYILTVQRITYGKLNQTRGNRPAVFLQHGLLDSSFAWVANFPNESLAYLLADAGFDVWLGNVRGNTYGRQHKTLTPKDKKFWDFSWDEMAKYDLPALVNYTLNITSQPSLFYAGHSQGTEIAFAGLSTNADLASKMRIFFALAPVTNLSDVTSPIKYAAPFVNEIEWVLNFFGDGEFLPSTEFIDILSSLFCDKSKYLEPVCSNIVFLLVGYDCEYTNQTRLSVYTSKTPAGTSVKNMVHYGQSITSKKFSMFDYGEKENIVHYNQATPPEFNISNIHNPVVIYYGANDWLATPADVKGIISKLPNVLSTTFTTDYNHLDYTWGVNARSVVYENMIQLIKSNLHWIN